ncbi:MULTISPECIES: Rad52/Rad22 family DNA repair protein [unclassified Streptomyces]|uniref:Rad52/Rad22 family DNA repair protein n=1 Tax=unclassified Streptomyces TaxID=2593676 RepID=UPI0008875F25|nr:MULTISPECIES: Rad52/Rad22 family DNA repair protein [unclassified Streptomyces]PBC72350.1 Rad52/22 family double-strand break repair protein [Streptomyces sp. 2321.6]SDR62079.1 Rad52/22 family double-strand break repair protein [Streptomyces sp. KS_16]SEE50104.1 Rad52/22 family double-strand break repair protein [Streptomyces sp. 2133.1]SNC77854.1 Rad52/22 family double-strand break repair protein [Streptomyces sp. 2114.4]
MANTQAPATAEGPTQHTQNQAPRFTPVQLRMLHKGIAGNRVCHTQGQSYVEAWDVRRHLIRIFGFGGFSIETLSLDLVSQQEIKPGRWTVVYRAQVRLTVYAADGREITHFEDGAAGDAINQPKLGDAHDMAMKTALSQALKRCAVNLGDQFGLGLYNGGKSDAVVHFSAPHPPNEWQKDTEPQPEPVDPPVQPEPEPDATQDASVPAEGRGAEQAPPASESPDPVAGAILAKFYEQAKENWQRPDVLTQIKEGARQKGVLGMEVPGLAPERKPMPFEHFLDALIARATAANRERNAA